MNKAYSVSHTMRKGKEPLPFSEKERFLKLHLLPSSAESTQSLSYFVAEYFVCSVNHGALCKHALYKGWYYILGLASLKGAIIPRETQRWKDGFRSCSFLLFHKVSCPSLTITDGAYFFCASACSFCICIEHKRVISYSPLCYFTTGRWYS